MPQRSEKTKPTTVIPAAWSENNLFCARRPTEIAFHPNALRNPAAVHFEITERERHGFSKAVKALAGIDWDKHRSEVASEVVYINRLLISISVFKADRGKMVMDFPGNTIYYSAVDMLNAANALDFNALGIECREIKRGELAS